ncbi:MAG: nitroreductase family protein [Bacillota bacterium]|nr:nitroreductase family protein [Bacillota bacterium]
MNLYNAINSRISIRKYEDLAFDEDTISLIKEKLSTAKPLYDGIRIRLELLEASTLGLGFLYGLAKIVSPYCIVAVTENKKGYLENIGFIQEQVVLELTDMGIGTCWLGTYNKEKIQESLNLSDSEIITNVIAVGYPYKQKNFRNGTFRNLLGSGRKKDIEMAYCNKYGNSAAEYLEKQAIMKKVLHMCILAPSGGNRQPVRVVFTEDSVSFFVENKKNGSVTNPWAELDAGIFISHFYLCCLNENINASFYQDDSSIEKYTVPAEFSYIISMKLSAH